MNPDNEDTPLQEALQMLAGETKMLPRLLHLRAVAESNAHQVRLLRWAINDELVALNRWQRDKSSGDTRLGVEISISKLLRALHESED